MILDSELFPHLALQIYFLNSVAREYVMHDVSACLIWQCPEVITRLSAPLLLESG